MISTQVFSHNSFFVIKKIMITILKFLKGLNYTFDRRSGNCSISKLTPGGIDSEVSADNTIIIKNPADFFNFENSEYQYIGIVSYFLF